MTLAKTSTPWLLNWERKGGHGVFSRLPFPFSFFPFSLKEFPMELPFRKFRLAIAGGKRGAEGVFRNSGRKAVNCVGNVKFCSFCKNLLELLLTKLVTSRLERFVSRILIRRFASIRSLFERF